MSRSPNCGAASPCADASGGDEVRLRVGPGAWVVNGAEGIPVTAAHGFEARTPSDMVRWAMNEGGGPARMLLPGETSDSALAVLTSENTAPDMIRADAGPLHRARFSFRVQVGDRRQWFIVIVPTDGWACDATVHRTVGAFAAHVAEHFLRFAVADWPVDWHGTIAYGHHCTHATRLRMPAEFPPNTPMLTAGRSLGPQMARHGLAAITWLQSGVQVRQDDCIRVHGPMPPQVQAGCLLGLAVRRDKTPTAIAVYVPSTGAITPPQMAEVARRLAPDRAVFKRRG